MNFVLTNPIFEVATALLAENQWLLTCQWQSVKLKITLKIKMKKKKMLAIFFWKKRTNLCIVAVMRWDQPPTTISSNLKIMSSDLGLFLEAWSKKSETWFKTFELVNMLYHRAIGKCQIVGRHPLSQLRDLLKILEGHH